MLTLNLSAVDAATIHRAIHHQPLAASVATTEQGILFIEPNSYGNGSVALPNGVRAVGANPVKDSQYGRKMRAGSAVTLFNPQGSKQFEPRCVVIESLSAIAPPTVVSGLHFNLPHILEDLRGTACDPASATLNVGDPSRMRDDASLKANEALLMQSGKIKKRSRAHEVDLIDIAKVGSAACRSCEVKIPKGALRFGFVRTDNWRGHLQTKYLHPGCVAASGRTVPTIDDLPAMIGWDALDETRRAEAYVAIGADACCHETESLVVD